LSQGFENTIVLSDEFYREISSHPIPTDLEAVKVLAGAPAVLDLFKCDEKGWRRLKHEQTNQPEKREESPDIII
jgi:Plasmid encoded RepA protein